VKEAEWLAATDPWLMLEFLQGKTSDRKLRLFSVSCCRQVWHLMTDERSRRAIELSELFADEGVEEESLRASLDSAMDASMEVDAGRTPNTSLFAYHAANYACFAAGSIAMNPLSLESIRSILINLAWAADEASPVVNADPFLHLKYHVILLREIIGNPFRPITPHSSWRTSTVVALASGIYADRAFDRMPILADALQDAGCVNADILNHCRCEGVHIRGCWVVDLILGKD
jgi:hypothetical protein